MSVGLESAVRWGLKWHTVGFDPHDHMMYEDRMPVLFRTRAEARQWVEKKYGYIRNRKDLRGWPHGWRIPQPIRVKIVEVG